MLGTIKRKAREFFESLFQKTLKEFHERERWKFDNVGATVQPLVRQIYMNYRNRVADNAPLPNYREAGFRVYSQFDEDGLTLYVLGAIGMKTYKCIDIGAGDCLYASNTANLVNNFGFEALFIDVRESYLNIGKRYYNKEMLTAIYPPKFVASKVTAENINDLIKNSGFEGEIDFLSIDIDGNDFWILKAIEVVSPRVVVIESAAEFGTNNAVVPYDADYAPPGEIENYHGASITAISNMMKKKGYRLVASNIYGFNNFFVRNDIQTNYLPEITVEEALQHPRNVEVAKEFKAIEHLAFEQVAP